MTTPPVRAHTGPGIRSARSRAGRAYYGTIGQAGRAEPHAGTTERTGYSVRKGERAIRILAPIKVRLADDDPAARDGGDSGDPDEPARMFFRAVPVFDRSQVDPLPDREPTPLDPPSKPITGDSHAHLLGPLRALADELGYRVKQREDTGAADGWCDHENKRIVTAAHLAPNATVRVLVHELAHALGIGYADYGRARAEVLVDTVTYIVCAGAGLDVSSESVPYVAGWGQDDATTAVRDFAATIDTVARRIEQAIEHHPEPTDVEVVQAA